MTLIYICNCYVCIQLYTYVSHLLRIRICVLYALTDFSFGYIVLMSYCLCRMIVAVLLILVIPIIVVHFYNISLEILTLYDNSFAPFNMRQHALSPDIPSNITNYTEFWQEVHPQENDDCLYSRNFDVDRVLMALRQSKVLAVDLFKKQTSLKFKLTLEGGKTAIFKVRLM